MPSRVSPLVNGEYYHVFNRGVNKMQIFNSAHDYKQFVKTFSYYQFDGPKPKLSIFTPSASKLLITNKIVEIICYCLMPNHFHFLLKQLRNGGISEFISKISNSYTKYFNIKNERVGPLLQGEFKDVHVETDEQLIHLTRYIHINPIVNYLSKDLDSYTWSSYHEYVNLDNPSVVNPKIVMDQFKSVQDYEQFCLDQIDYAKKLEGIKHLQIDE